MKVWLGINGLTHGPYGLQRVREMLTQKTIRANDWAWSEHKAQWISIAEHLERFEQGASLDRTEEKDKNMNDRNSQKNLSEFPSGDIQLDAEHFGTWMLFPYVCKDLTGDKKNLFAKAIQTFEVNEDEGFRNSPPEDQLKRGQLDRWLLKEPRALFRKDRDDENEYGDDEVPKSPRMRWMLWDKETWKYPFVVESEGRKEKLEDKGIQTGNPRSYDLRIALLNTKTRSVTPLPNGMQLEAFSLISNAGVIMLVVKVLPPRAKKSSSVSLQQAMDLNYNLAHTYNFKDIPILFPNGLLTPSKNQQIQASGSCVFSDQEIEKCLTLWPHRKAREEKEQDDEIDLGEHKLKNKSKVVLKSFPEELKGSIIRAIKQKYEPPLDTYQASRGRTTLFTRFLLPEDDALRYDHASIDKLEGLCSRCMQHPQTSQIVPLPTERLKGEEFKTMHMTGSQRIHLSCESALSFGINKTDYSGPWQDRWGSGFLLCYLIAYHQSILCQELSWSSFKKSVESDVDESRDLNELYHRFIEYCTHYDFSVVSIQLNQQRLYRLSREVMGVPAIAKEVGDEIQTRLDTQRNQLQKKFNQKQQDFNDGQSDFVKKQDKFLKSQENFNSLAVVFFLLGCSTFLLNLNLEQFTEDAKIAWDFSDKDTPLESLWLWVPVGLTVVLFLVPRIRSHLFRVVKLLFGKD